MVTEETMRDQEKVSPTYLTVLCVIAYIHVGMSIVMGIAGLIFSPTLGWYRGKGLFGLFTDSMNELLGFNWSVVMLVMSILAFLGIFQIWKMRRLGVYLFSIPLFGTIILPLILMGVQWWILIPHIIIIFFLMFLFALNYQRLR